MVNLSKYPKSVSLSESSEIEVRVLGTNDEEKLLKFMQCLPPDERVRFRDDVTDREVIREWTRNINLNEVIPLVVVSDKGDIIADWTLHHREHGWTRHHGNIRGVVLPEWREKGIATLIVCELLSIATQLDVERVVIELVKSQMRLLERYEGIGFEVAAVLKDWVKDFHGAYHDTYILSMKLEPAWRKMEEMILDYGTHGG